MKKRKKLIRFSVIGLIIVIIFFAIARKKGWVGEKEVIKISTEFVEKRNITETVSANGKIQPETEVKISPDVSGEVVELYVKEGDQVHKGDLLAKINPDIYVSTLDRMVATLNTQRANLANSKARLAQSQAQFLNAKLSFDRTGKLLQQQAVSQSEYDAAKSSYDVAKADVDAAEQMVTAAEFTVKSSEAAVKEARDNLTKTTIPAPMDGTVSKLSVEKGERVVGTSQFAGTEIMRIADLTIMEANVVVNENDIVRVKLGDTALVEVDAYLNRKFKGIVTEIANSANVTGVAADQVTNFDVKIKLLQDSYKDLINKDKPYLSPFRPGMSCTVDIQTKKVADVLTIPIQAVTTRTDTLREKEKQLTRKEGGEKPEDQNKKKTEDLQEYVFLYRNGKAIMQKVKSGIQDNAYIEIQSGLKLKDEVIVAPYSAVAKRLKDGDMVKKVDKKELFVKEKE